MSYCRRSGVALGGSASRRVVELLDDSAVDRKNRLVSRVIYPSLVLTWLGGALTSWVDQQAHRAIVSAIFTGVFLVLWAWPWFVKRHLQRRAASSRGHRSPTPRTE